MQSRLLASVCGHERRVSSKESEVGPCLKLVVDLRPGRNFGTSVVPAVRTVQAHTRSAAGIPVVGIAGGRSYIASGDT